MFFYSFFRLPHPFWFDNHLLSVKAPAIPSTDTDKDNVVGLRGLFVGPGRNLVNNISSVTKYRC